MKTKPVFLLLAMLLLAARSQAADSALSFSGSGSQFVQVPNFDGLGITTEVTVEFWAAPEDAAQRSLFVLDADSGANRFQAHLPWVSSEFIWDFGNIGPPSQTGRLVVAAPAGSVGSWRHYALVATQSGNAMRIYQNGTLIASKAGMDPLETTNSFLRIGGNSGAPYKGSLDDFRIWNVARTEAQIRAGMISPPLGDELGLRLYLRFDEPSGATAVNSATATGAAFNGTLNGAITRVASPFTSRVVTTNADSGAGSLRQAIADATAPSLITFAAGLNGGTITLASEITVNTPQALVVDASTLPGGITLSGGSNGDDVLDPGESRIFNIANGAIVTLRGLRLTHGMVDLASEYGGAVLNQGHLTMERCRVEASKASLGGGLCNNIGTMTLLECTVSGNSCYFFGGGVCTGFGGTLGTLTLTRCTIAGNTSSGTFDAVVGGGGGVMCYPGGTVTISHCTIANNTATGTGFFGTGGGIRSYAPLNIIHSTISGNSAAGGDSGGGGGGGVDISADATLTNTIVAGNTGGGVRNNNGFLELTGQNILQSVSDEFFISGSYSSADPLLAPLADNGGPTQTMALLPGSPAIDDASVIPGLTTDQRGLARSVDGDGNGSSAPDIGAFEVRSVVVTTLADENDTPASGGTGISLREALRDDASGTTPADTIGFAPALNGQTLTLGSELVVADTGAVTVAASSLPAGLRIDGGPGNNRLFSVPGGTSLTLSGLTLSGGGGFGATFTGNGGAIFNQGTLTLTRCTLSGNSDGGNSGGAIYNDGTLTLTHCTLSGNSAGGGGALLNASGRTLTLTHCTLSGNSAQARGGAIYNFGTLTLTNSIAAGNSGALGGPDIFEQSGTITPTGVNFIGDPADSTLTASATLLTGNPLLGPLANNGGPTPTMALLHGSPAINAATGSSVTADQRGQRKSGGAWDLGAYERQPSTSVTTTANSGEGSLRVALLDAAAVLGANVITFAPGITGPVVLSSELVITDAGGVTIDGSGVTAGVTITGGNATRLFTVNAWSSLTLKNLTLTGGNASGGQPFNGGGAIFNNGALTLERCTLHGNNGTFGGAIFNESGGTASMTRCTLAGNGPSQEAGALWNRANATLIHCTVSANSAANFGGILNDKNAALTLVNTLGAGNTGAQAADIFNRPTGWLTRVGTSLTGTAIAGGGTVNGTGAILTVAPQLAPLGNYGGPTRTMALLPGSPARNAAPSPNFVPNASFETDTFGSSYSYTNALAGGAITGWTSSPSNHTGLCITGSPFANSGTIPDGTRAAFLQSSGAPTTLSTTLCGLTVGTSYTVTFRATARLGTPPAPSWSVNGGPPVAFDGSPVGAGQPYRTITGTFTATATTAALSFTNQAGPDSSLLLDAVTVSGGTDQRGFPLVGVPDIGAYEAGTLSNFDAFAAETPGAVLMPTSDADRDGRSDLLEYAVQTDPRAASNGEITPATYNQNLAGAITQANVSFQTRPGATDLLYVLKRSTTLGSWLPVATWNAATGVLTPASGVSASRNSSGIVSATDTNVNGQDDAFYRLEVTKTP